MAFSYTGAIAGGAAGSTLGPAGTAGGAYLGGKYGDKLLGKFGVGDPIKDLFGPPGHISQPDKADFQYKGQGEDFFQKYGDQLYNQKAVQADLSQFNESRGLGMQSRGDIANQIAAYKAQINNPAYSVAQQQLAAGQDANAKQALMLARSGGGGASQAAALRGANAQNMTAGQTLNQQSSILRAQEYQANMGAISQLATQQRSMDLQAAGLDANTAMQQAQLELGSRSLGQQGLLGMYGLGQRAALAEQAGAADYWKTLLGAESAEMQAAAAQKGALLGAIGTGGAAAIKAGLISDVRTKTDVLPLAPMPATATGYDSGAFGAVSGRWGARPYGQVGQEVGLTPMLNADSSGMQAAQPELESPWKKFAGEMLDVGPAMMATPGATIGMSLPQFGAPSGITGPEGYGVVSDERSKSDVRAGFGSTGFDAFRPGVVGRFGLESPPAPAFRIDGRSAAPQESNDYYRESLNPFARFNQNAGGAPTATPPSQAGGLSDLAKFVQSHQMGLQTVSDRESKQKIELLSKQNSALETALRAVAPQPRQAMLPQSPSIASTLRPTVEYGTGRANVERAMQDPNERAAMMAALGPRHEQSAARDWANARARYFANQDAAKADLAAMQGAAHPAGPATPQAAQQATAFNMADQYRAQLSDERSKAHIQELRGALDIATGGRSEATDAFVAAARARMNEDPEQRMSDALTRAGLDEMDRNVASMRGATARPNVRQPNTPALDAAYDSQLAQSAANIPAYSFRYKEPYARQYGPEPRVGVMAQDLERNPATAASVRTGPDGLKRVDAGQLTMTNTAFLGELARIQQEQEQKINDMARRFGGGGVMTDNEYRSYRKAAGY